VTGNSLGKSLGEEIAIQNIIPESFLFNQNYPNPFNPSTTITYALPSDGLVSLRVFDMRGRLISTLVSGYQTPGHYEVQFNAAGISSGAYIYVLESGSFSEIKKMVYLK